MESIKDLPDAATWWEIQARIRLLAEVNTGREELERGEGTTVTRESEFLNLARGNR